MYSFNHQNKINELELIQKQLNKATPDNCLFVLQFLSNSLNIITLERKDVGVSKKEWDEHRKKTFELGRSMINLMKCYEDRLDDYLEKNLINNQKSKSDNSFNIANSSKDKINLINNQGSKSDGSIIITNSSKDKINLINNQGSKSDGSIIITNSSKDKINLINNQDSKSDGSLDVASSSNKKKGIIMNNNMYKENNTNVNFISNCKTKNDNDTMTEDNQNQIGETVDLNIKKSISADPIYIKRSIHFLIERETEFNEILKSTVNILIGKLERCADTNDEILNKVDIRILFKFFPEFFKFSTKVLNNLKRCLANYDEFGVKSICELFSSNSFDCSPFIKYSENYEYSIEAYYRIREDDIKFDKIENILKCHNNEFHRLSLKDLLYKPINHFVIYRLFLKDIQKKFFEYNIYDKIEVIIEHLMNISDQMNNNISESIQIRKFFDLNKMIMGFPADFISYNRKLIFDFLILGNMTDNIRKHVYLFSDCLMVVRPSKKAKKKGYHYILETIMNYKDYDFVEIKLGTKSGIKCIYKNNNENNNNLLDSQEQNRISRSPGLFGCFKGSKQNSDGNDKTIYFYFTNQATCSLVFEKCIKQKDIILGKSPKEKHCTFNLFNEKKGNDLNSAIVLEHCTRSLKEKIYSQYKNKGKAPVIENDDKSNSNQVSNSNEGSYVEFSKLMKISLLQDGPSDSNSDSLQDNKITNKENLKSEKENEIKEQPIGTIEDGVVDYGNDVKDNDVKDNIMNDSDVHGVIMNDDNAQDGTDDGIKNDNNVLGGTNDDIMNNDNNVQDGTNDDIMNDNDNNVQSGTNVDIMNDNDNNVQSGTNDGIMNDNDNNIESCTNDGIMNDNDNNVLGGTNDDIMNNDNNIQSGTNDGIMNNDNNVLGGTNDDIMNNDNNIQSGTNVDIMNDNDNNVQSGTNDGIMNDNDNNIQSGTNDGIMNDNDNNVLGGTNDDIMNNDNNIQSGTNDGIMNDNDNNVLGGTNDDIMNNDNNIQSGTNDGIMNDNDNNVLGGTNDDIMNNDNNIQSGTNDGIMNDNDNDIQVGIENDNGVYDGIIMNNNNVFNSVLNNDNDDINGKIEQEVNINLNIKYYTSPLNYTCSNNKYNIVPPFSTYNRNNFDIYLPYRTYSFKNTSTENYINGDDSLIHYLIDNGPQDPDTSFILY